MHLKLTLLNMAETSASVYTRQVTIEKISTVCIKSSLRWGGGGAL